MNFILNLSRRLKNVLKRLMNVDSDPFVLEETTIRRLNWGLFKSGKECTNCEKNTSCIRACKKCKVYICASCFVHFVVEDISFKSLCRNNHSRTISTLVLEHNNSDESNSSMLANLGI